MPSTPRTSPRSVAAALLAAVVIATAGACGAGSGTLPTGLGDGGIVIGGVSGGALPPGNLANAPFVGRWFRGLVFVDSLNTTRTSETTWTFTAEGGATRVVVARNVDQFFSDSVVSSGTWSVVNGTTLVITFTATGGGSGAGSDSTGAGGTPPIVGNPPFDSGSDGAGTVTGTVRYTWRVDRSSLGATLYLDATAYAQRSS